jgi:hypothetical protein
MVRSDLAGKTLLYLLLAFLFVLGSGACSVKLIADYDSNTFEEILKVSKKIDQFYGNLLETSEGDRKYLKYAAQYVEIETDIRSLVTRNQARPLNIESTKISETILTLWIKYKQLHQEKDGYSSGTAKLDRTRFVRLFNAASAAEEAKKLDPEDRDAKKESKDVK